MTTGAADLKTTRFRVPDDESIDKIYHGALDLLESAGGRVYGEAATAALEEGGASVDGDIVSFPRTLVEEMLSSVPQSIEVGDRNGDAALSLESHNLFFGTGSDCPFIIDAESGERRQFLKTDIEDAARVVDACPNLDFHMSLGLTSDVPTYSYDRHQAAAMLRNTIKPLVLTAMSRDGLADILEIYYLVRGGREAFEANPGFVVYLEPTSPLVHSKTSMEKLVFAAEHGIPAIYTPCAISGATAPVTLAGTVTLATAEFLAGMVVSQLTRRGASLLMGGVVSPMDMRTTTYCYGAPELHLMSAALTDIAHWLKIPVFSTAGCSDSKSLDEQAAVEASLSIMAAALSGANLIHDVGFLDSALTGSHEMVVLSDEIIGMVKHFTGGMKVDDESIGLDAINQVGPGGNFLAHEHTVRHMRQELWFPALMDRSKYDFWLQGGSKTLGDRIRERVASILTTHEVPPLPSTVDAGIDEILERADKSAAAEQTQLL